MRSVGFRNADLGFGASRQPFLCPYSIPCNKPQSTITLSLKAILATRLVASLPTLLVTPKTLNPKPLHP